MLPAELLVLLSLALTLILKPASFEVMTVFVAVWVLSPFAAYTLSKIRRPERKLIRAEDIQFARLVARRTWRFFEAFVGTEDNWLPPDNFQEDPTGHCPSYISNKHRTAAARHSFSSRSGLSGLTGIHRASGVDLCDAGKVGKISGTLLQLV